MGYKCHAQLFSFLFNFYFLWRARARLLHTESFHSDEFILHPMGLGSDIPSKQLLLFLQNVGIQMSFILGIEQASPSGTSTQRV